jgi:hypothetical protein
MLKSRENNNNNEYLPSLIRLRLLVLCKDFQNTVKKIRKMAGVPTEGLVWLREMVQTETKDLTWDKLAGYEPLLKEHNDLLYESDLHDDVGGRKAKASDFKTAMEGVAEKYNLPYSLVARSYSGVPYYILTNDIKVDRAYEIHPRLASEGGNVSWLNVRIYEKMKFQQLQDMARNIFELQDQYFNDALRHNVSQRKQIERDLDITEALMKREHKPKLIKEYDSVYLTLLKKSGASKKELAKAEKKQGSNVSTHYDLQTSQQLGKEKDMKAATVRSAKKRLNKLAKQWFGHSLEV